MVAIYQHQTQRYTEGKAMPDASSADRKLKPPEGYRQPHVADGHQQVLQPHGRWSCQHIADRGDQTRLRPPSTRPGKAQDCQGPDQKVHQVNEVDQPHRGAVRQDDGRPESRCEDH